MAPTLNGAFSKQDSTKNCIKGINLVKNCIKGVNPVGLHSDPEKDIE
ncbi:unnamed protein product [marine sediment metagenome]|uniref:Uncharacterized protein n=1 Tax=marine sediment metagenome TaxID=412755 RepID=X1I820_9ZZZZ